MLFYGSTATACIPKSELQTHLTSRGMTLHSYIYPLAAMQKFAVMQKPTMFLATLITYQSA